MLAFEVERCPIDGTILSVCAVDGPVPPCPTCALKAELTAQLKALEERLARAERIARPIQRTERSF